MISSDEDEPAGEDGEDPDEFFEHEVQEFALRHPSPLSSPTHNEASYVYESDTPWVGSKDYTKYLSLLERHGAIDLGKRVDVTEVKCFTTRNEKGKQYHFHPFFTGQLQQEYPEYFRNMVHFVAETNTN